MKIVLKMPHRPTTISLGDQEITCRFMNIDVGIQNGILALAYLDSETMLAAGFPTLKLFAFQASAINPDELLDT
jgi:hypothetical protein